MEKASMEEVVWQDVRDVISTHNKILADIIDEIDPSPKYKLYKVHYPFGSEILKEGILQLPNAKGELVPITNSDIKKSIQDDLGYNYNSNPVSLVLKNTTELFTKFGNRVIPIFDLVRPGKIFGLWNILNTELLNALSFDKTTANSAIWSMTAGSRFLFMLPKISRTISHYKLLQKLNIQTSVPVNLLDHWYVFKEIEQKTKTGNPWVLEILFFSSRWFQSLNSIKWIKFHNYLLKSAWIGSEFWRQRFIWEMVFAAIQEKRNIRPDPYITNTVEHLFAMGIGAVPGFVPAIDNTAGPIKKIKDVYSEIYNLEYDPIIMQPQSFSTNPVISRPVYYSLQFPTTIELSPKARVLASKITDLVQIQHVLKKFQDEIIMGNLNLEKTELSILVKNVRYDFFHTGVEHFENIRESKFLPIEDKTFLNDAKDFKNYKFPENSPFVRGCIRLSLANDKVSNS